VPEDNPFVGQEGAVESIWSFGHRNIQGAAFHPETGDFWVIEHGPQGGDELNLIEPGANYGWPLHLGPGGEPDFTSPVHAYDDPPVLTGCAGSPTAGGLYFGEGYTGNLHRLRLPGPEGEVLDEIVDTFEGGITDVAATPDGTLWVVTPNRLYRSSAPLVPAASATPSPAPQSGSATPSVSVPSQAPPPTGGVFTAGRLIVIALLVGGLLLLRGRLLRR
jgi:glucose/arabinose dehydrogenase